MHDADYDDNDRDDILSFEVMPIPMSPAISFSLSKTPVFVPLTVAFIFLKIDQLLYAII